MGRAVSPIEIKAVKECSSCANDARIADAAYTRSGRLFAEKVTPWSRRQWLSN